MRGRYQRINCECIADHRNVYIVQIDQEDEDFFGVNPFQIRVDFIHQPTAAKGKFLMPADEEAILQWDKLSVLKELWEPGASHKPTLFYLPLSDLPSGNDHAALTQLENDFRQLIGPNNIIVRSSVAAGAEKLPNLRRGENATPSEAVHWCVLTRDKLTKEYDATSLAFVFHRFIPARASAWVRAEPDNPVIEIHSLWGLPDALQYCPHDIWEVHLPTEVATEYPEYKSHILIAREGTGWEYVRVKNELCRSLCIGRREALDLAKRTAGIASRLDKPCHVMWFVGCAHEDGSRFNVPWYWTPAHKPQRNS